MDRMKIKFYCQYCLKLQSDDRSVVPISSIIKENFFRITQKQINTTRYSENICCEPCLLSFETFVKYRDTLLKNQQILENLFFESTKNLADDSDLTVKEEVFVKEENDTFNYEPEPETFVPCDYKIEDELPSNPLTVVACKPEPPKKTREVKKKNSEPLKKKYQKKKLDEPIICSECGREFLYRAYFIFHFKDVHQKHNQGVCHHCGKSFKNQRGLKNHILTHQPDSEKQFTCETCSKKFGFYSDFLRHRRSHEGIKPHKCPICGKGFVQSYAMKLHLNVHYQKKYTCDRCASQFSNKRSLNIHMVKCKLGIAVTRIRAPRGSKMSANKLTTSYKCFVDGCDRSFTIRSYLGKHLEKVHNLKFDSFETTCHICQLVFDTVGEHAIHVQTHTCNFICGLCKKKFKTEEMHQAHMLRMHKEGEDRPFVCQEPNCGAQYKRSAHLRSHQKYKHSDERNIECSYCGMKFLQRGAYNDHLRIHTNEKPFSCWQCNFVCARKTNLRSHMLKCHNETRIYICTTCQQRFQYHKELTLHEKEQH